MHGALTRRDAAARNYPLIARRGTPQRAVAKRRTDSRRLIHDSAENEHDPLREHDMRRSARHLLGPPRKVTRMNQNSSRSQASATSTKPGLRMRAPAVRPLAIVIVENGSCWPSGFEPPDAGSDCLVIAEQIDESAPVFAERVIQRIRALHAALATVTRVTFAIGHDCGPQRRGSRSLMARTLFDSCILAARGSIDFVAHEMLDEEARHELLAFAGTLLEQVGYNPPAINVKFASPQSPASGIRRTVPTRDGETFENVA